MNLTQLWARAKQTPTLRDHFIRWNAERLGISVTESERRMVESNKAIPHASDEFREFCETSARVLQVFASASEPFALYRMHADLHFLRMLSYIEPDWPEDHAILKHLRAQIDPIRILDFGCGLAHSSRHVASRLQSEGRIVELTLADVAGRRLEFLEWACQKQSLSVTVLPCTETNPFPALGWRNSIVFATEFFEHVEAPERYMRHLVDSMRPGAILVTNINDHVEEFFHLTPDMSGVRELAHSLGLCPLVENRVFVK